VSRGLGDVYKRQVLQAARVNVPSKLSVTDVVSKLKVRSAARLPIISGVGVLIRVLSIIGDF
jgi:hypothetical protein